MLGALLYLRLTSLKNWVRSRALRLRQPKYLIGAIVGAAYFWFFFIRHLGHPATAPMMPSRGHGVVVEAFPAAFILVQVIVVMAVGRVIMAWIAPDKPGLVFTEAEIAFLFPAPVTRRALIHYKLLSAQLTILFSAALVTLISNRWSALGGNAVTHAVGWWIIFSTINLHNLGAAFTVARLVDRGVGRTQRRAVIAALLVGLLLAVAYVVFVTLPPPTERELGEPTALFSYVRRLADTGLLHWLLYPVRMVAGPFFATTWRDFFFALGPAFLLLGLHYVWVLRSETSFEEASIALAEKRARVVAARTANARFPGRGPRRRPGPFPLASSGGRPEIAFLWKNLLSTRSFLNHRTFIVVAVVSVGTHAWFSQGSPKERAMLGFVAVISLMIAVYAVLLGPQLARQDLRSDLGNVDLLKTYPLRGWQVMLGQLLTPVAILTGVIWLALLTATLDLGGLRGSSVVLQPTFRAITAGCLAVIVPLLCLLQLMIPNAATLLFPSWAQTTRSRERGLDVMGQRLIFVAGQLVVIVCALLPAVGLGVLLWFAGYWFHASPIACTLIGAAGILGVLLLEICFGLAWLGHLFERFDLSGEAVK
jgi:hypothetical protein